MGIIEFIIKEFTSYVAGKAFDKIGEKLRRTLDKKELERRFEAFCNNSRWRDVFENQGFAGAIDFTGLTEELKESIVDHAYEYYHSLDTQREEIKFEQYLEGLNETAKADAAPQKKQVQEIVYAAYHLIGAFYVEKLSPEDKVAVNFSMRYTDERIAQLVAEIKALAEKNAASIELLESYALPTPGFLGRQGDLAEIERRFKAGDNIVVICGQGGMGKSELAKEYSRIHRDDYEMVCFAYYQGSVAATVTDGLLWSPGGWNEKPPAEQFEIKRSYMQSLAKRVLLILDDVAAMDDYANLLKICGRNVEVLITTRKEKLIDARPVMLGSLGYEDGLLPLFRRNAELPDGEWDGWYSEYEAAVKEIIQDILLGHTMLVILAARLLAATDRTVEDIRDSLKNSRLSPEIRERIHSYKDAGREGCGAADATLCEHVLSLYSISTLAGDQSKITILRNMSLIPYSGVSRAMLQEWLGLEDLNDVNELIDSGWLTLSTVAGEKRVAMHAVISDAVYIQTEPTVENCVVLLEAIADNMMINEDFDNPADKAYMIEFSEFVLRRLHQENCLIGIISHQTGYLLKFRADYDGALKWYIKALAIFEKIPETKKTYVAAIHSNIGGVYHGQGNYPKALEYYYRSLDIDEIALGKEHLETAVIYNNIALIYSAQCDYIQALEWYNKSLIIKEKVLGKEHPSIATTYNNIAGVYNSQGDYARALDWYLKDLAINEKILGKEHPNLATTYNNIAVVCKHQGNYPIALEWYYKALAISERVLGKNHPDTAAVYNNIAQVVYCQGDYTEALEWFNWALDIREKVLGKEHPDTATTYNDIAAVCASQGNYAKALEFYNKTININEKVLGKEHPDIAAAYNNIAGVYSGQGEYTKAMEWYAKAQNIAEKMLGKEHPNTATTYNNIAEVYDSQGDYTAALEWYGKGLEIREKVLGKEHPDTAATYNNIARVYEEQGNYSESLEWYNKALEIKEKVLGKEHPDTAATYNNIATVCSRQRDYTKALEWYQKALEVKDKVLGKEHPDTATTYNNIGVLYAHQEDFTEALVWLGKSLTIWENKLGKDHPYTVRTRRSIAEVKRQIGGQQE